MDRIDLKNHLDSRLDRIEDKLDNHLGRISKAEEAIMWMKGHLKIATTFFLTIVSGLAAAYLKLLGKL